MEICLVKVYVQEENTCKKFVDQEIDLVNKQEHKTGGSGFCGDHIVKCSREQIATKLEMI